jgi:hypothetical protein
VVELYRNLCRELVAFTPGGIQTSGKVHGKSSRLNIQTPARRTTSAKPSTFAKATADRSADRSTRFNVSSIPLEWHRGRDRELPAIRQDL